MVTQEQQPIPSTFQALFRSASDEPLELKTTGTPAVIPGSVLIQILYAWIPQYASEILSNGVTERGNYGFSSKPFVVGLTAVGRVAAVAMDAVSVKVGDLVVVEPTVRARDDPRGTKFLQGWFQGSTPGERKLSAPWTTGAFGEMMLVPLENVNVVDEKALAKLGTTPADLAFFGQFGTAFGGLRNVDLRSGETVLIAPATGTFGGAAVHVALAMGANVIAVGRRKEVLDELAASNPGRVNVFQLDPDGTLDSAALIREFGEVDVFCDFTPAAAAESGLTKAGILAVKGGGRVCLVGGVPGDVTFPYAAAMWKGLTIKGSIMICRDHAEELVKLVETGRLPLGKKAGFKTSGLFPLWEWKAALENAKENSGPGRGTFFDMSAPV